MLSPRHSARSNSSGSGNSVVTIVVLVLVIAGVLGWAIYDSRESISVRQVPTEKITVPTPEAPQG